MWDRAKGFTNRPQSYAHVTVCLRWLGFEQFLADMGERPAGTSLDRRDNRFGYNPDNCRWATDSVQNANRRRK